METKRLGVSDLQLKFVGDDMSFAGYASVFGGVDAYGDTIDPKAYDNTLLNRNRPIRLRWNHYGPVIGKWKNMFVDDKGLFVEGTLNYTHKALFTCCCKRLKTF